MKSRCNLRLALSVMGLLCFSRALRAESNTVPTGDAAPSVDPVVAAGERDTAQPTTDKEPTSDPARLDESSTETPGGEGARAEIEALKRSLAESRAQQAALSAQVERLTASVETLNSTLVETQAAAKTAPPTVKSSPLKQGNFYLGGTLGLSYTGRDNYETIFGSVDDGHRFATRVEGLFGRILREESFGLGMSVSYQRKLKKGALTDPASGESDQLNSVEYRLSAGPAARAFLPLDAGQRFFLYVQASLLLGYQERVERLFEATSSSVSSANGFSASLGVRPGLMVAATPHFAVEVGIDLLGIDYQYYKITQDYDTTGRQHDASLNVDVNLLSLQFAFVGYF